MSHPWSTYVVPIVDRKTGERRTLVVDLSPEQQADILHQIERHAVPRGFPPLERTYALQRAVAEMPSGYEAEGDAQRLSDVTPMGSA